MKFAGLDVYETENIKGVRMDFKGNLYSVKSDADITIDSGREPKLLELTNELLSRIQHLSTQVKTFYRGMPDTGKGAELKPELVNPLDVMREALTEANKEMSGLSMFLEEQHRKIK